jgi:uncharacterized protein involved in outer membrane biogenesis
MNVSDFGGRRPQHGGLSAKLLLVLTLGFALGAILWVVLLPGLVVATLRARTGFAVKVDGLSVNPFTGKVAVKGLVLKNPDGWPAAEFVDLREFRADAELFSLFAHRLVADEVVVDVAKVTVVRNQQGAVNAAAFRDALAGRANPATPGAGPAEARGDGARREFLIRHLVLRFDRMAYADYSAGHPRTKEYALNVNRDLRDVDSVAKLVSPFTGSALGLATGTLSGRFPAGPDLLNDLRGGLQDAGKKTGEKFKALLDSLDKMRP